MPFLVSILLAACSAGPRLATAPVASPDCVVVTGPSAGFDLLRVAFTDLDGPRAVSTNESDLRGDSDTRKNADPREVFADTQIYETLTGIDCTGRAVAGLAVAWTGLEADRVWRFALDPGRVFEDGTPLTAASVVESWRGSASWRTVVDSVAETGPYTVDLFLPAGEPDLPGQLAWPDFVITESSEDTFRPMGTGRFRAVSGATETGEGHVLESVRPGPVPTRIRISAAARGDARDLFPNEIDLVVTGDPRLVEYAGGIDGFRVVALPWSRRYYMVWRSQSAEWPDSIAGAPTISRPDSIPGVAPFLASLARDAVRGDARPADTFACRGVPVNGPTPSTGPHDGSVVDLDEVLDELVFDESDAIARQLAERIAALSSERTGGDAQVLHTLAPEVGGIRIRARDRSEVQTRMAEGRDRAYVVSVPVSPIDSCSGRDILAGVAPWAGAGFGSAGRILPLIDTRSHLIIRDGVAAVSIDGLGRIRIIGTDQSPGPGSPNR